MTPLLLALPENETMAGALAERLGADRVDYELRQFPDEESYVRILCPVQGRRVALVCTLARPNDKMLPLLLLADTLRQLGAASVGLVAPYLAYMRQDRQFHAGEGITSETFGHLLSTWVDWLVTVDPHLHRRKSLSEIYTVPTGVLHAAPLLARWIRDNVKSPVLVGPDEESAQWVEAVAADAGAPHVVLEKIRRGDRDVQLSVPEVERWHAHTPVLVDDIISTARTMVEAVRHLNAQAMRPPVCIGVHGIFAGSALAELQAAGAQRIVTCNTVAHETNVIDVSRLVAEALTDITSDRLYP